MSCETRCSAIHTGHETQCTTTRNLTVIQTVRPGVPAICHHTQCETCWCYTVRPRSVPAIDIHHHQCHHETRGSSHPAHTVRLVFQPWTTRPPSRHDHKPGDHLVLHTQNSTLQKFVTVRPGIPADSTVC